MAFKKGDKRPEGSGKKKGSEHLVTKTAKETFVLIMEGQVDYVENALLMVMKKDPARYLDCLSKLMPYFMPKQIDMTSKGQSLAPMIIDWTGSKDSTDTKTD